jgi:hypothetical protein
MSYDGCLNNSDVTGRAEQTTSGELESALVVKPNKFSESSA